MKTSGEIQGAKNDEHPDKKLKAEECGPEDDAAADESSDGRAKKSARLNTQLRKQPRKRTPWPRKQRPSLRQRKLKRKMETIIGAAMFKNQR